MNHRTRVSCTLAVALTAAGLAGCGGSNESSSAGEQTKATARGGDFVFARAEDTASLDPAQGVGPQDIAVTNQIFDRLYDTAQDGKLVPRLAASDSTSADGRTLRITLREATFSDGSPVTSADVKFSLDRSRKADGAFSYLLGGISSISTPDERTVVLRTTAAAPVVKAALSAWVASILPKDLGGKSEKAFFTAPIGSGPFTFSSWKRGTSIKLERNARFWESGRPLLESVTFNRVPDSNTRVAQVKSGQADAAEDVPFNQVASLNTGALSAKGFPANYTTFLILNQKVKGFSDVHARRAIAHAIDREALTKATLFGNGSAACSMVPPTMPLADNDVACLSYDLSAAKAELAKSKTPDGFSASLTIDNQPGSASVAQILQSSLEPLGIKLTIKTVDSGQLYTVFDDEAFELGLAAWASDIPDPDAQLSFMLNPKAGGNAYYTGYDNAKVNDLLVDGQEELDATKRAAIYSEIQSIAASEVPQIPLSNRNNSYVWSDSVQGFQVNPMGQMDLVNIGKSR